MLSDLDETDDQTDDELPGVLADLEILFGRDVALSVARECGGMEFYLGMNVRPSHPLVVPLGIDRAQEFANYLGIGQRVVIPLAHRSYCESVREKIYTMDRDGYSSNEIARTCNISSRRVQQVKSEHPSLQCDMFEYFEGK